jgi:hypothetical protein
MEGAPQGGTARSAPQQAPKGRFAQAAQQAGKGMETIRNATGKVMGKIPMGQAAKMLAKGAARFVPGVGLVLTGAEAVEAGMNIYDRVKSGKAKSGFGEDGGEYVAAAEGGPMKGQVKGTPRNVRPDMSVGMMKAQIGNYRSGGRIL